MKIVFQDIDGVLNTGKNRLVTQGKARPFDPEAISQLNRILLATGAKIVVASTWRLSERDDQELLSVETLDEIFTLEGLAKGSVIDRTPSLSHDADSEYTLAGRYYRYEHRRNEIAAWLREHPEVTHWVTIDDDPDADPTNLVLTDEWDSLTEALADLAIEFLRG